MDYLGRVGGLTLRQARVLPVDAAGTETDRTLYREKMYAEMMRRRVERQEWLRATTKRSAD